MGKISAETQFVLITGAIFAATGYGIYKLVKLGIEADEAAEKKRVELKSYIRTELDKKDYSTLIKKATLFNEHLDSHQRNIANDILNDLFYDAKTAESYDDFDDALSDFEDTLEVFQSGDPEAMLAMLDRRLQVEANRALKAQRDHELAIAKAAGENEIQIAKISADAERAKASLYSKGITGAASILKEVTNNERKQESED